MAELKVVNSWFFLARWRWCHSSCCFHWWVQKIFLSWQWCNVISLLQCQCSSSDNKLDLPPTRWIIPKFILSLKHSRFALTYVALCDLFSSNWKFAHCHLTSQSLIYSLQVLAYLQWKFNNHDQLPYDELLEKLQFHSRPFTWLLQCFHSFWNVPHALLLIYQTWEADVPGYINYYCSCWLLWVIVCKIIQNVLQMYWI